MKDPMTLAFSVKIWPGVEVLQIWHRDRHGSDGACGWTYPHLTEEQGKTLKTFAWCEARDPYYLRTPGKAFNGSRSDAEKLYRALLLDVARDIGVRLSLSKATLMAIRKIHRGGTWDSARVFCWLPGWHTNSNADTAEARELHFYGIICGIARELLADTRPWWRHPRWHIHHWRLHFKLWSWFKRCYIIRCKFCHKHFGRKVYPTSSWSGVEHWHSECAGQQAATTK